MACTTRSLRCSGCSSTSHSLAVSSVPYSLCGLRQRVLCSVMSSLSWLLCSMGLVCMELDRNHDAGRGVVMCQGLSASCVVCV